MPDVIELARFRVAQSSQQEFLASYPRFSAAMEGFEGLKSMRLARLDDGSYVFVALWARREDCQRAMATCMSKPAVAAFLSHIEEEQSTDFADVIDAAGRIAA